MPRFVIVALLVLLAPEAGAVSIGVFADSAGTNCSLSIPYPGTAVQVFVVASLEGLAPDGVILGAFRITGLPEGWNTDVLSTPGANVAVGDVFGSGAWIAYPACVLAERQVLMEVTITPTSSVQGVALFVEANQEDPADCFMSRCGPCPRFCGCDLLPTCYCVTSVDARINGPCSVALEHGEWGFMKLLYR